MDSTIIFKITRILEKVRVNPEHCSSELLKTFFHKYILHFFPKLN